MHRSRAAERRRTTRKLRGSGGVTLRLQEGSTRRRGTNYEHRWCKPDTRRGPETGGGGTEKAPKKEEQRKGKQGT